MLEQAELALEDIRGIKTARANYKEMIDLIMQAREAVVEDSFLRRLNMVLRKRN